MIIQCYMCGFSVSLATLILITNGLKKKSHWSHFLARHSTLQPAGQLTHKLVNMPTDQTSGQWPSVSLPSARQQPRPRNPLTPSCKRLSQPAEARFQLRLAKKEKKKRERGKSTLLIMILPETGGKCITVSFYIRVLSRCLSTPPPPRVRARLSNPNIQTDTHIYLSIFVRTLLTLSIKVFEIILNF